MKRVLLIAPTGEVVHKQNSSGIGSWAIKFVKNFKSDHFEITSIDAMPRFGNKMGYSNLRRILTGLWDLIILAHQVRTILKGQRFDIMHTTTSGSFGSLRDYVLCRICKRKGTKCILHCRYGAIPTIIECGGFNKWSLLLTMKQYDNIWILDRKTEEILKSIPSLNQKIYLIPNGIDVPREYDNSPKKFNNVAFIGNLIPTKGIFELIEAFISMQNKDVTLFIVGGGSPKTERRIAEILDQYKDKNIQIIGPLPNPMAVEFLKSMDILALPTYFPSEAFPISILEAMSLGKLVISTYRAAIPDMLTDADGSKCGLLVGEKNASAIREAIEFCIENAAYANMLCEKAYRKVRNFYSTEIIYNMIETRYASLLS
ncbi:MAG: glycosyltransferase family 4 protein [Bacteroidota bacterium]|nr:glycosyltransferase family 4 protein [Bacteroidota bacterium]